MEKYIGVYIHIPFCASKCAYCDFYSRAGCEDMMPRYQQALIQHIKESAPQLSGYLIDTVYFGGGTPSYYGASRLIAVFNALKKYGRVLRDAEVTLEANPDSINLFDLIRLKNAGFNRISIGAQCADDAILKGIGRRHTFSQVEEAMANARSAGFGNVSLDLIYGLPEQTREGWAETLTKTVALRPEHLSCYGLKIEEGSQLWQFRDAPFIPDDDTQADMYLYAVEALKSMGYRQYEISNFAQRGMHSRHNMRYWLCDEYMGFGAAAHSYVGGVRYSNIPDMRTYADSILSGGTVVDFSETISPLEQASEYLMLGLRTVRGISEKEYTQRYRCSFREIRKKMEHFMEHGWAAKTGDSYHLTPQGFLVSNTLINEVLDVKIEQQAAGGTLWAPKNVDTPPQMTLFEHSDAETEPFRGIS